LAEKFLKGRTPPAILSQPPPRRVEPRFFVKAMITLLALLAVAFFYAIASPKLGIMLGIFGGDELSDRTESTIEAALGATISSLLLLYQTMLYRREKYLMSQGAAAPAIYTGYYEYVRHGQTFGRVTYASSARAC
jgi:hypothetical protein